MKRAANSSFMGRAPKSNIMTPRNIMTTGTAEQIKVPEKRALTCSLRLDFPLESCGALTHKRSQYMA